MKPILEIYETYGIPRKLQLHMLRATACSQIILDHWKGPDVNRESLTKVMLLHDMGNLVKIGEEEFTYESFVQNRKKYFDRYGKDDHKISEDIGRELGMTDHEVYIMNEKVLANNDKTIENNCYEIKIGAYCDQRVEPDGVYGIKERLEKAKIRYKDKPGSTLNCDKTDYLIECACVLEKQIMQYCTIKPEEINDQTIGEYVEDLEKYCI